MRILSTLPLFLLLSGQVLAADLPAALQGCLQLTADHARLQCYDQLARSTQQRTVTPATPATPATQTVQVAADPIQSFGLENRVPEQQVEDLKLTVKAVRTTAKGRLEISMQNGQVWLQIDDSSLDVKAGDVCTIARATFGSFLLDNGRSNRKIRVRRVD